MSYVSHDVPKQKYCKICGYKSNWLNDVRRHIESKHMFLKISCKYCPNHVLSSRRTLECHLKKQHSIANNDMMEIINWHVQNITAENIEMCYQ